MNVQPIYCLAIDQGTFSTRAVLFDQHGGIIYSAQKAISLSRLDAHKVEQDGEELLASVRFVIRQVFNLSGIDPELIKTAGLSTQRSSLIAWRPSSGNAISPVLSWQDTRATNQMEKFCTKKGYIQKRTGLYPNAHYGASKIQWLIKNNKRVTSSIKQQDCVITPLASYILFNISDHKDVNIDIANASRTLLCNLLSQAWDNELLELFDIPKRLLPKCRPIIYDYGNIKNSRTNITAVNGDQTAAIYSNGSPDSSVLKVNLGTGAFVLTTFDKQQIESERFSSSHLIAGISNNAVDSAEYYIEGTVNGAASAIRWLQDKFKLDEIRAILPAQNHCNTDPFIFMNSIGGMGSPIWRSDITPCFIDAGNKELELNPRQALIAVLESIVFLLLINILEIEKLKKTIQKIEISGGLSNVDYICQALANLSGFSVQRSEDTEATARGICWLALVDKAQWEKVAIEQAFSAGHDQGLEMRFNHFKQYLKEKLRVSIS